MVKEWNGTKNLYLYDPCYYILFKTWFSSIKAKLIKEEIHLSVFFHLQHLSIKKLQVVSVEKPGADPGGQDCFFPKIEHLKF